MLRLAAIAACLLAVGCASQPVAQGPAAFTHTTTTASVDAGPPDCAPLQARIVGSQARNDVQPGTWLDAPDRMVESRRLRALHARADALGCAVPSI